MSEVTETPAAPATAPVAATAAATETPAATPPVVAATTVEPAKPDATTTTPPPVVEKVVPEKYDLKIPDGSPLGQAQLDKISQLAKEKGLSNEEAQALVDDKHAVVEDYKRQQDESVQSVKDGWITSVKNDKEIGGENFNRSVELSKRVVEKFGSEKLVQELESTGLGNHPELVRAFSRIGKAMDADKWIPAGNPGAGKKSTAQKLYGSENKQ